jgi:hypothetical protein
MLNETGLLLCGIQATFTESPIARDVVVFSRPIKLLAYNPGAKPNPPKCINRQATMICLLKKRINFPDRHRKLSISTQALKIFQPFNTVGVNKAPGNLKSTLGPSTNASDLTQFDQNQSYLHLSLHSSGLVPLMCQRQSLSHPKSLRYSGYRQ